jgi:hypothetical protein
MSDKTDGVSQQFKAAEMTSGYEDPFAPLVRGDVPTKDRYLNVSPYPLSVKGGEPNHVREESSHLRGVSPHQRSPPFLVLVGERYREVGENSGVNPGNHKKDQAKHPPKEQHSRLLR